MRISKIAFPAPLAQITSLFEVMDCLPGLGCDLMQLPHTYSNRVMKPKSM